MLHCNNGLPNPYFCLHFQPFRAGSDIELAWAIPDIPHGNTTPLGHSRVSRDN